MSHSVSSKPHHTANGFRNNHPHDRHTFVDFLKWRWDRLTSLERVSVDATRFPVANNDPLYLKNNGHETTLTWVGHATLLLQLDGINILTDPHLTNRASPIPWAGPRRVVLPGLDFDDLPRIDLVLISHNHYDHLDLPTLHRLAQRQGTLQPPRLIVSLGLKAYLENRALTNIVELDWWEWECFQGLIVYAVPAQHFSARTPFDRNQTLWAGYVVAHPAFRFYFAGDTGYSPDFQTIGQKLGPMDLAAIPIGGYEPRWFMQSMHLNPEEAVQVHHDVRSRRSVAIHWGTFELTDEPLDEPPQRLRRALLAAGIAAEAFIVMQHGETRQLSHSPAETSLTALAPQEKHRKKN